MPVQNFGNEGNIFVLNSELNFKRAMEKIYEHGLRKLNREIEMENSLNPKSKLSILAAEITKGLNFYKIGLRIKLKNDNQRTKIQDSLRMQRICI